MKDQFVPYDLALKMKELGFDEDCMAYFDQWEHHGVTKQAFRFNYNGSKVVDDLITPTPLWQQAFDWFSDNKKMSSHTVDYEGKCLWMIRITGDKTGTAKGYSKFEKSRQEARVECLKKLIELCKK